MVIQYQQTFDFQNKKGQFKDDFPDIIRPIVEMGDTIVDATHKDNQEVIGMGMDRMVKIYEDSNKAMNKLREAYVTLEIRNSQLEYTNEVLRKRCALTKGTSIE